MGKVVYLSGAVNEAYSKDALDYIRRFGGEINSVAQAAKISAGAIAGAMAEENTAYGFGDIALDKYAKSGFNLTAGKSALGACGDSYEKFATTTHQRSLAANARNLCMVAKGI